MKLFIGTTLLLLFAGAPAFAGQEPDKDKPKEVPKKQEEPKKAPKPAETPKPEPARQQQDKDRPKQQEERKSPPPEPVQHPDNRAQDQQRAKQTEQHADHNAHPANANVRRVPEAKYRANFGHEHHFHVERRDDRRFNYSGFWFTYAEPWPGDWDYNDDVYIEDLDGQYYLLNPRHPGIRLIVVVGD
jgi:hypothetical protein